MTRAPILALLMASVLLILPAGAEDMDLRLRGKFQTRFEVEERPQDDSWTSRFRLRRARVDGRWMPVKWIRLVLELEGAAWVDIHDSGNRSRQATVVLRDAYGRFDLFKQKFQFQVGQFKKPFSRLKMESSWDLALPVRGLLNRYAVSKTRYSGYGGRDVGVMTRMRFDKLARLSCHLGVFSGPGYVDGVENSSWDYLARVQLRPFKGMRVALNASHKVYHYKEGGTLTGQGLERGAAYTGNLFGVDARLRLGDLTVLVEGALGDNVDLGPGHLLFGLHGTLAYALVLYRDVTLVPALMVEWFDPSVRDGHDSALRLAGALNLDLAEIIRVVVFIEGATGEITAWDPDAGNAGGFVTRRPPTRVLIQLNMSF